MWKQIENNQLLTTAAGIPFTMKKIIKAAEMIILKMGCFNDAYREWLRLTPVDKTYNKLKLRFTKEYQVKIELDGNTVQGSGYNIKEVNNITGVPPTSPTNN